MRSAVRNAPICDHDLGHGLAGHVGAQVGFFHHQADRIDNHLSLPDGD
jgi:hypothetical protein